MYNKMIFLVQSVPEGRVFGLDEQTLISIGINLLNAIILAAVLGYILYQPVKDFMRKRSERIQSKIETADADMAKANELIAIYDEKIKGINKERLDIIRDAHLKAADETKIILKTAKKEADEIKKRALESIEADKKRFKEEMRLHVIEISSLMAKKYITQTINSKDQDRLFEDALAQMEDSQWRS